MSDYLSATPTGSARWFWAEGVTIPPLLSGQELEWSVEACKPAGCTRSQPRRLTVNWSFSPDADSNLRLYYCRECYPTELFPLGSVLNSRSECAERISRDRWIDQTGRGPIAQPTPVANPEAARAAFLEVAEIFHHPRCTNCHVEDVTPKQRDMRNLHAADGRGIRPTRGTNADCVACHSSTSPRANYDAPFPPAGGTNAPWRMPPAEMAFEDSNVLGGLELAGDICRQIKQFAGSPEAVVDHLAEDNLVRWSFEPGGGRTPAHASGHAFLIRKMEEWAAAGGDCPD